MVYNCYATFPSVIIGNNVFYTLIPDDSRQPQSECVGNAEQKTMTKCYTQLVTALSLDILNISGHLLAKEFITEDVHAIMLTTEPRKAHILATSLKDKIKVAPHRFYELLKVFSEQSSTKEIHKMLQSAYRGMVSDLNFSYACY